MRKFCISTESSLLECMRVIDQSGVGIALAVDDEFRLIGTVSDGDLRGAVLKGCSLDSPISPHINRKCYYVLPDVSRSEVLDIMQARRFEQVPITDESGKVVGLHLLHDIMGNIPKPNWVVIMAGGKGTRLRPLTENIPKPMLKVAGRPILERIILHFVSYGICNIFLAINHLSHVIEDHFGNGSRFGARIEYLREKEPLGSGGPISLLPEIPSDPLLVMNGDLIVDMNFTDLIDFHDRNGFCATMGIYSYFHQVPYGCVEVQGNEITSLEEKPILEKTVNAGIYVLSPEIISAIPKNTFYPITSLFDNALQKKLPCGAFKIEKEWLDIGLPHQLGQARGEFLIKV